MKTNSRQCTFPVLHACALVALVAGLAGVAHATCPPGSEGESIVAPTASPETLEANAARARLEKELKKLRFEYFRHGSNERLVNEGLAKLRELNAVENYPILCDLFLDEPGEVGVTVRTAVLDMFAKRRDDAGDTTLAWLGIFAKGDATRSAAFERLQSRRTELKHAPDAATRVVEVALQSKRDWAMQRAAEMAGVLDIIDAIPLLISAQAGIGALGGAGGGGATQPKGDLAYIAIAKQVAFVADLQPVVAEGAVGFDPTLGVVNEGVLLRIHDAQVKTVKVDLITPLNRLASSAWGQPTDYLGRDAAAWANWYDRDFKPYWTAKQAAIDANAQKDLKHDDSSDKVVGKAS
ncbi:MAG: hypothetical protein AB7Q00_09665 [Phycisphaerales bacterium]